MGNPAYYLMTELTVDGDDFITCIVRSTTAGPQFLIMVCDEDGIPAREVIVQADEIDRVRNFFWRTLQMIDTTRPRVGEALN